jgi:hypothetical protein
MRNIQLPDWRSDEGDGRVVDGVICKEEDEWSLSKVTSTAWKNCCGLLES